jgi:hypothetical protein
MSCFPSGEAADTSPFVGSCALDDEINAITERAHLWSDAIPLREQPGEDVALKIGVAHGHEVARRFGSRHRLPKVPDNSRLQIVRIQFFLADGSHQHPRSRARESATLKRCSKCAAVCACLLSGSATIDKKTTSLS